MCGWPPSLNDDKDKELCATSLLLLFMLWKMIYELKNGYPNFSKAFAVFENEMGRDVNYHMNFQAYYDCNAPSLQEAMHTLFG
jgi:hypothetical protein